MISNRSFYSSSQMPLIFSGFSNSVSSANFFMLLLTEHKSSHHRSPFNPPADITLLPELVIYSYIPFLTLYQLFTHLRIFCLMLCSLKILAKKSLSKISGKISSNWPVKHLLSMCLHASFESAIMFVWMCFLLQRPCWLSLDWRLLKNLPVLLRVPHWQMSLCSWKAKK